MLVVTRKTRQSVIITTPAGERIRALVVDISRRRIRLGIQACPPCSIYREEVQQKIDARMPPAEC